ncbi:hypothetical protein AV530_003051 [Patagioenas fasciata monilis]|uniref:DUF4485 domain-containing protein n=1 Tax=Patagioenas fasciata monilis TaxID=372326 RepID=A0A1V4KVP9_PATFA|nr:hypothetical protein AV530_003051 [Patagioenas fasciata monilis]
MNGEEEIWEKLDAEFDHCVVDMKPHVLKLQHRSERQRCALWIKKLCEPSGAGTGTVGRKNRNLYAKLLLHMLKRGVLEGPFTHKPEPGTLKTLPSYMSIYFDEPNSTRVRSSSPDCLPDWVMGELGDSDWKLDESWKISSQEESPSATLLTHGERFKCNEKPALRSHSMSPPHRTDEDNLTTPRSEHRHKKAMSLDDSDLEARLNSWNLGLENPRYLREKPMPMSLMTPKTGLGKSSTFRDEQSLFRMHEKETFILDRKNDEIEVMKSLYKNKQNEAEETIRKLEKKVQTLVRESQVVREAKEKQIVELKKMCEQSNDSLNNEWEKRVMTNACFEGLLRSGKIHFVT